MRRTALPLLALAAATLLFAACANEMAPARKALADIESDIGAAATDAGKYVPDQLASSQAKLTKLKAAFEKKDYAAVMAGAPAALAEAQGLAAAAQASKDKMKDQAEPLPRP